MVATAVKSLDVKVTTKFWDKTAKSEKKYVLGVLIYRYVTDAITETQKLPFNARASVVAKANTEPPPIPSGAFAPRGIGALRASMHGGFPSTFSIFARSENAQSYDQESITTDRPHP